MQNPRLIAIAGPLEGAFFALPEETLSIGSDPGNTLVIDDASVAGRHCTVAGSDGRFVVKDAGGRTLINGVPVDERQLIHGDEVRIGDCLFLFLAFEAETPPGLRLEREIERLENEKLRLQAEINVNHSMVGESPAMLYVYRFINKVAPSSATVLVRGESGTGKELVARAIHRNSPRAGHPFVAINAAALTETLLESELFGHEKGSFTGAIAQKRGKLEVADGGTLFLDEIGEMAPALQAKLLRVLQEREFERVGGTRGIQVDIRVIAATNRDLTDSVRKGSFRQDLYYRLNVVSVMMPPLRDRRQDIPLLADYFLDKYRRQSGRRVAGISSRAKALLVQYEWPGNVRELENAIERAVVLGSSSLVMPEDLPEHLLEQRQNEAGGSAAYHEAVNEAKRRIVTSALEQAGGSCADAARLLGLHPNNLHRLIRNLGIRRPQ